MPGKKKKAGAGGAPKKGPAAAAAAAPAEEPVPEVAAHNGAEAAPVEEDKKPWPPAELFQFVTPTEEVGKEYNVRNSETEYVTYEQYSAFEQMQGIIDMMSADLSEPYPVFTYRYFIDSWPDLCWIATVRDRKDPSVCKMVGAITCKASVAEKDASRIRGYVAMLAVDKEYRNNGFGSKLVMLAVDTMRLKGCTEVVLETEIGNSGALTLYEGLGFVRDKRLDKYYQQGTDAFRLKLWLAPPAWQATPTR